MNLQLLEAWMDSAYSFVAQGGYVMLPIYALGALGWMLLAWRWTALWMQNAPWKAIDRAIDSGADLEPIWAKLGQDHLLGEAARGVESHAVYGREAIEQWIEESKLRHQIAMHRNLRTIGQIVTVVPLSGLLGTVSGMTATFKALGEFGSPTPALLAAGISEALVATESALVVAFPLLITLTLLNNRVRRSAQRHELILRRLADRALARQESMHA